MVQRYLDSVDGSDSNAGTSIGAAWKTIPKVYASGTSGDTVDIVGSSSESVPRYIPFGYDVFSNAPHNNFTFRNYGDTHIALDCRGRGTTRSGAAWQWWTAGGLTVQGGGSIRLGPMDPNDPLDTQYRFGVLQATGCTGLLFDGGQYRKLFLNGGGADSGMLFINDSRGPGDIIVRNYESTTDATGVWIRSNGTDTTPGLGGLITLEDFSAHNHMAMNDNRGTSGDLGAQCICIENHTAGVLIQRGTAWDNYAPSAAFVWDGGLLNPSSAANVTVQDCEIWDTPGVIESGHITGKPYCDNMIIRRNVFRGRLNPFNRTPPTDPAILLRDARDGLVENNTFYIGDDNDAHDEYYPIALYTAGSQPGLLDRLKVRSNIIVMRHNNARGIMQTFSLPTGAAALTIDYNLYYRPNGGTIIGNSANWSQYPAELAAQGVLGAEAHGLNVNPQFVDAPNNDFHLSASSPAINAGFGGVDMGAFQFDSSSTVATPSKKSLTMALFAPTATPTNTAIAGRLGKSFGHRGFTRKIVS